MNHKAAMQFETIAKILIVIIVLVAIIIFIAVGVTQQQGVLSGTSEAVQSNLTQSIEDIRKGMTGF